MKCQEELETLLSRANAALEISDKLIISKRSLLKSYLTDENVTKEQIFKTEREVLLALSDKGIWVGIKRAILYVLDKDGLENLPIIGVYD